MKRSAVLAALLLGACTVGPDYAEPQLAVPANYLEASASETASLDRWWQGFGDAQLSSLMDRALTANLDIEMATGSPCTAAGRGILVGQTRGRRTVDPAGLYRRGSPGLGPPRLVRSGATQRNRKPRRDPG